MYIWKAMTLKKNNVKKQLTFYSNGLIKEKKIIKN